VLAAGERCRVDGCDHGVLHLTLGTLTVRLSPDQLVDLARTLEAAARRVEPRLASRTGHLLC
jgi:hypothetical protein